MTEEDEEAPENDWEVKRSLPPHKMLLLDEDNKWKQYQIRQTHAYQCAFNNQNLKDLFESSICNTEMYIKILMKCMKSYL